MKSSSKTISTWNAGDEYLKYNIQLMRDFDSFILKREFENAFFVLRNWVDTYSPYLRDQHLKFDDDDLIEIKNHLSYCDFCLKNAEDFIFSNLKNAVDTEGKKEYLIKRSNSLIELRKVKRNLLFCMAKFNSLLPTQIKYDWLTESTMY